MQYLIKTLVAIGVICSICYAAKAKAVKEGDKVTVTYTLTVEGRAVDSATPDKPLVFIVGGEVEKIPATLAEKIKGMVMGKDKVIIPLVPTKGSASLIPRHLSKNTAGPCPRR
jgi:FKBP-type peptidyl-prolyl cis-trans isomerase